MTEITPEFRQLAADVKRHSAALYRLRRDVLRVASLEDMHGRGTMTFVEVDGQCYGVTNQHALHGDYWTTAGDWVYTLGLPGTPQRLPGELLFQSCIRDSIWPFDLAIFKLDGTALRQLGKEPVSVPEVPDRDRRGSLMVAVGFPAASRHVRHDLTTEGEPTIEQWLSNAVATCRSSGPETITLYDSIPVPEKGGHLGGVSGGAVYSSDGLPGYDFRGIVCEGTGPKDAEPTSAEEKDLWIFAHALTAPLVREMVSSGRCYLRGACLKLARERVSEPDD